METKHPKKKMDLNDDVLPEEYIDIAMQEFAYDPVKFSSAEDPFQVLYNRRTLETIWDTKHSVVNPYTRQPIHIHSVVPQTELRQQMREYLLNNESVTLTLGLQVIPDYSQILKEAEMKQLLNELVFVGNECLFFLKEKKEQPGHRNRKEDEEELKLWKALWKKLNLIRLYCQYSPENKEVFSSVNGYEYLFEVINIQLLYSCRDQAYSSSFKDAEEACKEVARIVDVMGGLKRKDLLMVNESSVSAFVRVLFNLKDSRYLKIRSMVLRIYRGMLEDCIFYVLRSKGFLICSMVAFTLYALSGWENWRDITNEDLYNGMVIFKATWIGVIRPFDCSHCVEIICMAVTVCISRLEELHDAHKAQTISTSSGHKDYHEDAISSSNSNSSTSSDEDDHEEAISISSSNSSTSGHEDHNRGEVLKKNIHFISMALDDDKGEIEKNIHFISEALNQGLFLIYSVLTTLHSEAEYRRRVSSIETLQSMNMIKQIVRLVKLVLAGSKVFRSSHLWFGLKIIESIQKAGANLGRMLKSELVRVLEDFLGSKYVDEYGIEVKQLVLYIVRGRQRQVANIKFR